MAMTVLSLMRQQGATIYQTATWRLLVESHLTWLRMMRESEALVIEPHIAYKYEGDLYGVLTELRVPTYLHWTAMRLNGLFSPTDFKGEAVTFMVPTQETMQQLAAMAATTQKKIT